MIAFEYGLSMLPDTFSHENIASTAYQIFGSGNRASNNDVINYIIQMLPYRDLRNFAMTCRLFFELARKTLQKQFYGKKYSHVSIRDLRHVHRLLTLAKKYPDVLRLVERVSIYDHLETVDASHFDTSNSKAVTLMRQIFSLGWNLIKNQDNYDLYPQEYDKALDKGGMNWAAVLLLLCPNIQDLGLGVGIAYFYGHTIVPIVEVFRCGPMLRKNVPLLHLDTLTLQRNLSNGSDVPISLATLLRIAATPSLRTLSLYNIHIVTGNVNVEGSLQTLILKLVFVSIVDCVIQPSGLARIIQQAPTLEFLDLGGNARHWVDEPLHLQDTFPAGSNIEPVLNELGHEVALTPLGRYYRVLKREIGSTLAERDLDVSCIGTGDEYEWNSRIWITSND